MLQIIILNTELEKLRNMTVRRNLIFITAIL